MNKHKIISLILALAFAVSVMSFNIVNVFAENNLSDKEIFDLKGFGIVEGDENNDLHLDDYITRAEFAKVVTKLVDIDASNYAGSNSPFTDLPRDHWAFNYILFSSDMGYVNGDGNGHFYPENSITFNEAVKILVCVLGFGGEAEKDGGYPVGYINQGMKIKLLHDVSSDGDQVIKRWQAFKLIANALDAKRLVNFSYGSNASIGISDKTLRDVLLGNENDGYAYFKGTVTANFDSWTINPNAMIKENEVEIDGVLFDKGNTNAEEYLGLEVEVYAYMNDDRSTPLIKQISPTKNNKIVDLDFDDIVSADKTKIVYQHDSDKRKTECNLKNSTVVLYNGRAVSSITDIDIGSMRDGSVRLISNTQDGSYNIHTVMINEYTSVTVDCVNAEKKQIYLSENDRINNMKYIDLDKDEDELKWYLYNSEGKTIGIDEVDKDDIITVYSSLDKGVMKIYVCRDTVSGTVTGLRDDDKKLFIDGEEYEYEKDVSMDSFVGKNVSAKLNYMGKSHIWKKTAMIMSSIVR